MPGRAEAAVELVHLSREDPDFYRHLGPFFGSRIAATELGGPIWDEPEKRWLIALRDGQVVGICAYLPLPSHTRLLSAYVLPTHRRQGIYSALFAERLRRVGNVRLTATVTAASLPLFHRSGFHVTRRRGRYTYVERDAKASRRRSA